MNRSDSEIERRKEYLKIQVLENVGEWGKEGFCLRSFVFNSRIIYQIKDIVVPNGLDVSWGHPIDDKGKIGPESDIIIFRGVPEKEWNGFGNPPVIRIVFVNVRNLISVIECKKKISIYRRNRGQIRNQKALCEKIKRFTDFGIPQNILWLLSERIDYDSDRERSRIANIVTTRIGFVKFFFLFDENKENINESDWISFLNDIEQLR
jgi:hypothetical protein